jgi:hypothetical protein
MEERNRRSDRRFPHVQKPVTVLLAVGLMLLAAAWAQQQEPTTDFGSFDKKSGEMAF